MAGELAAVGSSIASAIKAYAMPLFLLSLSMFYQLVVIPRSFPPSHYDALRIERYSSIEDVKDAYEKFFSNWNSGVEVPSTDDFIKIQYAYELLTNPLWKRDYDIFGIDEQHHVLEKVKRQYAEESYSHIGLPLLDATVSDHGDYAFNVITFQDFRSLLSDSKPWIVQVYSRGSIHCAQFFGLWKEIDALLDGVANTGMVELGDLQLATSLAERKPTRQFSFGNGLPSLVAVPPECQSYDCLVRFEGDLSMDAVSDWFATTVLGLPRILYYSKDSLVI
uniref:J domain-containing protein n=1 Tax=Rhizophora mucronata TaxID=61149 RepID=A0A2P2LZ25_RHIMU